MNVNASCHLRRPLFEIEREQRWRIWLLFVLLLVMVFVAVWVACLIVSTFLVVFVPVADTVTWVFTLRGVGLMLACAFVASALYWFVSQVGVRERLPEAMHCVPLDPGDVYHQRLANIVEEIRLSTGRPRVACVTVATLGFNAFSFSDLRGGGVIGVTEGALARLSRQQLQGVVAHEFGHILSGSSVTATVSCLLFGIYTSLGDRLEAAALFNAGGSASLGGVLALLLRGWLWVVQVGSTVAGAALSREREREADLAAARYTRDPLSLAEALWVIERHPGGAGYIPEGLAPLCIRDLPARSVGPLGRWRSTHPPVDERIAALLALANVSRAEFDRQMDAASERLDRREHWSPAPAVDPASRLVGLAAAGVAQTESAWPPSAAVEPPPSSGPRARANALSCPVCGVALSETLYEGVRVQFCRSCGGCLVANAVLGRVLARRDVGFTPKQIMTAADLAARGDRLRRAARLEQGRRGGRSLRCPRCGKTMLRGHYNYEHALEVDRCAICGLVWFDRDELEVLQVLTERQVD